MDSHRHHRWMNQLAGHPVAAYMPTEILDSHGNQEALEAGDLFYCEGSPRLLSRQLFSPPPYNDMKSTVPKLFPEESECYYYPKKQKSCSDSFLFAPANTYNSIIPESSSLQSTAFYPSMETLPPLFVPGPSESPKKPCGLSLSPQSIAARKRRRKISQKTHELGKLIPGGSKMNTAEMFEAAAKYVRFLRAQIAILRLVDSLQMKEGEEQLVILLLQALLSSPSVQEQLYRRQKCLIPLKFIQPVTKITGDG